MKGDNRSETELKARERLRRELLKGATAGSALYAGSAALPGAWKTPSVDSVVLPVHAQTTGGTLAGTFVIQNSIVGVGGQPFAPGSAPADSDPLFGNSGTASPALAAFAARFADRVVPEASAIIFTSTSTSTTSTTSTTPDITTTATTTPAPVTTTPGPSGPDCPLGGCGELDISEDGSFTLTVDGQPGTGMVDGQHANIAGVTYHVTDVDSLTDPGEATVTAQFGDCAPVVLVAVFTPGRCPA